MKIKIEVHVFEVQGLDNLSGDNPLIIESCDKFTGGVRLKWGDGTFDISLSGDELERAIAKAKSE